MGKNKMNKTVIETCDLNNIQYQIKKNVNE